MLWWALLIYKKKEEKNTQNKVTIHKDKEADNENSNMLKNDKDRNILHYRI